MPPSPVCPSLSSSPAYSRPDRVYKKVDVPLAGALAVGARARVPDGFVRHDGDVFSAWMRGSSGRFVIVSSCAVEQNVEMRTLEDAKRKSLRRRARHSLHLPTCEFAQVACQAAGVGRSRLSEALVAMRKPPPMDDAASCALQKFSPLRRHSCRALLMPRCRTRSSQKT